MYSMGTSRYATRRLKIYTQTSTTVTTQGQQQKVTLLSWFCSTRLLPSPLVCHMAEKGRGASPGSFCLVTEPEQPRQASTGLDGCIAEDFSQALGFSTDLPVQLVTKERRL